MGGGGFVNVGVVQAAEGGDRSPKPVDLETIDGPGASQVRVWLVPVVGMLSYRGNVAGCAP